MGEVVSGIPYSCLQKGKFTWTQGDIFKGLVLPDHRSLCDSVFAYWLTQFKTLKIHDCYTVTLPAVQTAPRQLMPQGQSYQTVSIHWLYQTQGWELQPPSLQIRIFLTPGRQRISPAASCPWNLFLKAAWNWLKCLVVLPVHLSKAYSRALTHFMQHIARSHQCCLVESEAVSRRNSNELNRMTSGALNAPSPPN